MTGPVTWVDDAGFHKRHATVEAARAAQQRNSAARAVRVRTPAVQPGLAPTDLIFERIRVAGEPTLAEMLAALCPLRQMGRSGLSRFDPFARILPRLADAPAAVVARVADLRAKVAVLNWQAAGVIHGDFHPGQLLRDCRGQVWLIELDDLALGPVEADLGNLAAWMATQTPGPLPERSVQALAQVIAATTEVDPTRAAHFRNIALIRRALKLRERGQDWALRQLGSGPIKSRV